jgi:hypothetical protein
MAIFITEDGTGLPDANAYITTSYFTNYHRSRGNEIETLNGVLLGSSEYRTAIVRATDYIDSRFRGGFVGIVEKESQSLEWPRYNAYYRDGRSVLGVPKEVQRACALYALRALSSALAPDPTYEDTNGKLASKSVTVGPISESIQYYAEGGITTFRKYPEADALLVELLVQGNRILRV